MKVNFYISTLTIKGEDSSLTNFVNIYPTFDAAYKCIEPDINACELLTKSDQMYRTDYHKDKDDFFAYYVADSCESMFKIEKQSYELGDNDLYNAFCEQEHIWDVNYVTDQLLEQDDILLDELSDKEKQEIINDIAYDMRERLNSNESFDIWDCYNEAFNHYIESNLEGNK